MSRKREVNPPKVTIRLSDLSKVRPRNVRTREEIRKSLLEHYSKGWRPSSRGIQHMLDLDEKYPEVDIFGPQCISAEVGYGWKDLVESCLVVLREHGCKAGQIKQKWGGLRFYWDHPEGATAEQRDAIRAAVAPVIAKAEEDSYRTCEDCGEDLGKPGGPCYRTQCGACEAMDRSEGP